MWVGVDAKAPLSRAIYFFTPASMPIFTYKSGRARQGLTPLATTVSPLRGCGIFSPDRDGTEVARGVNPWAGNVVGELRLKISQRGGGIF
jgi:hypothetical protein